VKAQGSKPQVLSTNLHYHPAQRATVNYTHLPPNHFNEPIADFHRTLPFFAKNRYFPRFHSDSAGFSRMRGYRIFIFSRAAKATKGVYHEGKWNYWTMFRNPFIGSITAGSLRRHHGRRRRCHPNEGVLKEKREERLAPKEPKLGAKFAGRKS